MSSPNKKKSGESPEKHASPGSISEKEQLNREYLKRKINPLLEPLVRELLLKKPDHIHDFMIDFIRHDKENPGAAFNKMTKQDDALGDKKKDDAYEYPESEEDDDEDEVSPMHAEDLKKKNHSRHSVSAEAFGKYHKRSVFKPRIVEKTQEQIERITERLSQAFMFSLLEERQRKIVIDALDIKKFKTGDWVIKQGEDGDVLYIVFEGTLECYKQFKKDEEPKHVKTYNPGESFGELALLYNAPRAASIKAVTDCTLLALDRETFNAIVKDAEVHRRERFEQVLGKVELLESMDPYERTKLSDVMKIEKHKAGEYIIKQGDEGNTFYIIEEGKAVATKILQGKTEPEVVLNYKPGDYFGELALLHNEPRQANIIAESDVSLLVLDRQTFNRVLGPLKEILQRNAKRYEKYM